MVILINSISFGSLKHESNQELFRPAKKKAPFVERCRTDAQLSVEARM